MENNKAVLFELNIENDRCIFPNTISDAIIDANKELKDLEDKTFKGNKKMLSALNMKKKEFKIDILNAVEEALLYSYK